MTNDFKGRELTAIAIAAAAIGSAALNTYGAFHIFPNPATGWIIAGVILACELIAFLAPRHIVKDWDARHYWKARFASLILVFAIAGCVISGKQAFGVLFLEANHNHKTLQIRANAVQATADQYQADILAGNLERDSRTQAPITVSAAQARWERMQKAADEAKLEELKAAPPPTAIVYVLLALFEMTKIGGLFFIATQKAEKGLTWKQRTAKRQREQLDIAKSEQAFKAKLAAIDDAGNVVELAA